MHITKYLNKVRDENNDDKTIITLIEIIEAERKLCENFFYNPTQRHAREIFDDIIDWDVEEAT